MPKVRSGYRAGLSIGKLGKSGLAALRYKPLFCPNYGEHLTLKKEGYFKSLDHQDPFLARFHRVKLTVFPNRVSI